MPPKADARLQNWEDSSFPTLCQTCLGDNPYIRMQKERYGKECKVCTRPFTCFRWCPGKGMRYKTTQICQICAKLKNICQTCLLDLEYGLPVEVRDRALGIEDNTPRGEVNREYYAQNMEQQLAVAGSDQLCIGGGVGGGTVSLTGAGSVNESASLVAAGGKTGGGAVGGHALLKKLARNNPYYQRNKPHICSFFVKGECKRGEECPYRHEMPHDPNDPLSKQNIKDRYYGTNDPVAAKMFDRAKSLPKLVPPGDKSIMTLYIGGISPGAVEADLRDHFYQFGTIVKITLNQRQAYAFVTFDTREEAEAAAAKSYGNLTIKGHKCKVMWARSQKDQKSGTSQNSSSVKLTPVPGLPSTPISSSSTATTTTTTTTTTTAANNNNNNNTQSMLPNSPAHLMNTPTPRVTSAPPLVSYAPISTTIPYPNQKTLTYQRQAPPPPPPPPHLLAQRQQHVRPNLNPNPNPNPDLHTQRKSQLPVGIHYPSQDPARMGESRRNQ